MKEWIVLQGWPLYLMLGMTGLGLLGSILSRIFYGRLAREAQLCGTSDYPMLHYIRQKYSSYYKLGMRPGNAEALVKRYLALHRVGPLALYSWNEAGNFMMGAVMLTGLIRGIYRFQTTMQTGPALMDIGIGLVLALGLRLTGKIFSVERLQVITLNAICDYLGELFEEQAGRRIWLWSTDRNTGSLCPGFERNSSIPNKAGTASDNCSTDAG